MNAQKWFRAIVVILVVAGALVLYRALHPAHGAHDDDTPQAIPNAEPPAINR